MKFDDYAQSFVPEKNVILGIELRPLSLGHYLLMKHFGSGFASDKEASSVGWDDLILSLIICSMTYQDFLDFIDNKENGKKKKLWYAPWKYDETFFIRTLKKEGKKLNKFIVKNKYDLNQIKNCIEQFVLYIKSGSKIPKYWEGESVGKSSGAHWSQIVFTTAISELGYSRSEALNLPLNQLFNDFFKLAESQGGLELMNEEEEDLVLEAEIK